MQKSFKVTERDFEEKGKSMRSQISTAKESMVENRNFMKELMDNMSLIPKERIISKIYWVRGTRVMFDADLAELYAVSTKRLNEQVQRNKERFPEDFMFQLNLKEVKAFSSSRSQIATLKRGQNVKYAPYVFTEQGVAMLSSVLRSKRAVAMNIHIVRVFTRMREVLLTHKELREKIDKMEQKYDKNFRVVFDALKQMLAMKEEESRREIGFRVREKGE